MSASKVEQISWQAGCNDQSVVEQQIAVHSGFDRSTWLDSQSRVVDWEVVRSG